VLGGSSTARLFQEVRVKRALSYGAYSGISPRRDEGLLTATAGTKNESAVEVAQVMLAELERLGRESVEAAALDRRKTFVTGSFARQVETTTGLSTFLSGLALQGLPMSEFGRFTSNLQAVTPQQVGAAVAAELPSSGASIVIVGDAKAFAEPLRQRYPQCRGDPVRRSGPGVARPAQGRRGRLGPGACSTGGAGLRVAAGRACVWNGSSSWRWRRGRSRSRAGSPPCAGAWTRTTATSCCCANTCGRSPRRSR
jgi:hypothetical protein